jgi:hypothetical protein
MTDDCLPHQVSDRELTSWIDNSAFDNNGEVEFVEFIEVINMLSRRARAYEREKAVREYGGGGASPNGAEQSRQQAAGAAGREDADADADTDGEGGADDAPSPPPAAAALCRDGEHAPQGGSLVLVPAHDALPAYGHRPQRRAAAFAHGGRAGGLGALPACRCGRPTSDSDAPVGAR